MAVWSQGGSFQWASGALGAGANVAPIEPELEFLSGANNAGAVVAQSFWTWNGDNPATYASVSSGHKWGSTTIGTAGETVYYYFDPASGWTAAEQNAFAETLTLWSDVANIQFVQTLVQANANVTLYRGSDGSAYENDTTASATIGGTTLDNPSGAMISIDTSVPGFGPIGASFGAFGGYPWETLVHEEGHILGLGHGGPYNGNVDSATQQLGPYDTRQWSLMSYIDPWDASAKYFSSYVYKDTNWGTSADGYSREATTWMPLDILAAQRLYGAPTTTPLSGGQTFGFHCNVAGLSKPFFDFTQNQNPVITLWDEGTHNTFDLSGYATKSTIDLIAGAFSSCDGMTNNVGIGFGVKIDRAVGGSAGDVIYANADGDTLIGGAGNDKLVGGAGADKLTGGLGRDVLSGGAGADQFIYNAPNEGGDAILDFHATQHDLIMVKSSTFGHGLPATGALPTADFALGAHATAAHAEFVFNPTTHVLSWDADGSGAGAAVAIATLTGVTTLTAASIHIF